MSNYRTPLQLLEHWNKTKPNFNFLHQPRDGGQLDAYNWQTIYQYCLSIAGFLKSQGYQPGDKVALFSKNCAEWFIADWAMMMAGIISIPIYPTASSKTISYVLEHSQAKAIFVGKLDNWSTQEPGVGDEIQRISMNYATMECHHDWQDVINFDSIDDIYEPSMDDVFSIIYTSGSTGAPKGVVITYQAYSYACETNANYIGFFSEDRVVSYLPLAHITERALVQGSALYCSPQVYFVESLDTFQTDLARAKPTLFVSVPRLWKKFQSGVHGKLSPTKLKILLAIPGIKSIAARKIKTALGLGDARTIASGSAPISPATINWYRKLGINICEGWGLTETAGFSCANFPFDINRIGTIGEPVPGTEIRISDIGEIEIKSPGLFTEYYLQPDLTAEAFTYDGWFKTGDKGHWDNELNGYRITGRVKELFKTEKGKYIAPVPIEAAFADNPLIEQICIMGTGLAQPVAVAVLSQESIADLTESEIKVSLETTLNTVNLELESHEKISHMVVGNEEWTIENELLTPTMKIKRSELEAKYLPVLSKVSSSKRQIVLEDDL